MLKIGHLHFEIVWPILESKLRATPEEKLEQVGLLLRCEQKYSEYPPEKLNCVLFMRDLTFLVCSSGHCVIVSVRDVLSYMMLVCVLCVFWCVFRSQDERSPRDVQRTLQSDSRNHTAVAQIQKKFAQFTKRYVMCRKCEEQSHISD